MTRCNNLGLHEFDNTKSMCGESYHQTNLTIPPFISLVIHFDRTCFSVCLVSERTGPIDCDVTMELFM